MSVLSLLMMVKKCTCSVCNEDVREAASIELLPSAIIHPAAALQQPAKHGMSSIIQCRRTAELRFLAVFPTVISQQYGRRKTNEISRG